MPECAFVSCHVTWSKKRSHLVNCIIWKQILIDIIQMIYFVELKTWKQQ